MTPARPGIWVRLLLAAAASMLWLAAPARGQAVFQSNGGAVIHEIDASAFPDMSVRVAVRGAGGRQYPDLPASAFALAENGIPVERLEARPTESGAQVVFLIVPDESFIKRDATGTSRIQYVLQSIGDFLVQRPWMRNGLDDVSVITPTQALVMHSATGVEASAQLRGYELAGAPPPSALLEEVTKALELAQPSDAGPGRAAALVVYASGLSNAAPDAIDQTAAQARAQGVTVHAVNVSAPMEPEAVSAVNLRRLAEGAGGQMVYFTATDAATPIFQAIDSQRVQYEITYRSRLNASGLPAITVLVRPPDGTEPMTSAPATFSLTVLPPEIGVSGLTPEIRREAAGTRAGEALPAAQEARVAVAFPDGHAREVARLDMLVDGVVVASVTEPPFNRIAWDPAASAVEAGAHTVQVQLTDELGLTAVSMPFEMTLVDIEQEAQPAAAPEAERAPGPWLAIGAGVLLVGLAGAGGLALLRRRPGLFSAFNFGALADGEEAGRRPTPAAGPPATIEPALAPRAAAAGVATLAVAAPLAETAAASAEAPALRRAYLELLHVGEGARAPIELGQRPVTLGRDPALAGVSFTDRSVSRLHARVALDEKGEFHIYDEGSTSGTWVNYEQVTSAGRALQHGDLVNLGRVQMRFRLRLPEGAPTQAEALSSSDSAERGKQRDDTTIPFKPQRRRWGSFRKS